MALPFTPYFLARDASGQVWRVDDAGQSKVAVDGVVLYIDQLYLDEIGAVSEIQDFSSISDTWLASVPTAAVAAVDED